MLPFEGFSTVSESPEATPRPPLPLAPRLLYHLTWLATGAPRLTVLLALALTVLSGWIATDLDVRTGKLALVPKDDPEVQLYLATNDEFGTLNRLLVVLDGPRALDAAATLAERLGRYPEQIAEASARVDLDSYVDQYLHTISRCLHQRGQWPGSGSPGRIPCCGN